MFPEKTPTSYGDHFWKPPKMNPKKGPGEAAISGAALPLGPRGTRAYTGDAVDDFEASTYRFSRFSWEKIGNIRQQWWYPLVNWHRILWRIALFLMGKSTISNGQFQYC